MNTNPNITLRSHPGTATRLDAGGGTTSEGSVASGGGGTTSGGATAGGGAVSATGPETGGGGAAVADASFPKGAQLGHSE